MVTKKTVRIENRRIIALSGLVIVCAGLLLFQLFSRSVLSHGTILVEAKSQQLTKKTLDPTRGTIYASSTDGISPLATTDQKFTVAAVPKNIKDKAKAASVLASALGLDEQDVFNKINNNKLYIPPLAQRVDKAAAQKIVDQALRGIVVTPVDVRFYPENQLAASVLGFVDYQNKGEYGIEGYYNDELRGLGGTVLAQKDNKGRVVSIVGKTAQAQNGDTLVTTIDQNVQFTAEQKLKSAIEKYGATSGQIAIIDIKTGAILAMAALPSFDPNKFNEVKRTDQNVFLNPIIGSIYEPGSIMKPMVVGIGLDTGALKADDEGDFGSSVTVQGYEIHTATNKAFGHETVTQVLENSDNVAMVSFGDKIGNDAMHDYFEKLGFGAKYGIDSNGETTGTLQPAKKWHDINRATMSFGQGVSVTPLQILMGYQAIANDGKLVQPHLVSKIIKPDGSQQLIEPKVLRQVYKPETAQIVRQMLVSVVVHGHGKKAAVEGYQIGGKTGTAQIPNKDSGGYEADAHIGSFAGIIPADNPRFAMLVKLDRPTAVEFAESSAAPTFGEVAKFLLQYYQIPKSS